MQVILKNTIILEIQIFQISTATNIDTIKSNIAHPYKQHEIHNIDSTLSVIKDEYTELDENETNEYDSKEFFTDFNYKCDSDDEPLAKKIKTKRKSVKNYVLHCVKTEIDYDVTQTDDFENQSNIENFDDSNKEGNISNKESNPENNKISNLEHSKKVIIANWEFDLVTLTNEQQIKEVLSRKETANYMNSRYKCNYCYKGFMTEVTYKNHMILHDEVCGFKINTRFFKYYISNNRQCFNSFSFVLINKINNAGHFTQHCLAPYCPLYVCIRNLNI